MSNGKTQPSGGEPAGRPDAGGRPANTWTPIVAAVVMLIVLSAITIAVSMNFRGRTDIANDPASTATPTATASAPASDSPSPSASPSAD